MTWNIVRFVIFPMSRPTKCIFAVLWFFLSISVVYMFPACWKSFLRIDCPSQIVWCRPHQGDTVCFSTWAISHTMRSDDRCGVLLFHLAVTQQSSEWHCNTKECALSSPGPSLLYCSTITLSCCSALVSLTM